MVFDAELDGDVDDVVLLVGIKGESVNTLELELETRDVVSAAAATVSPSASQAANVVKRGNCMVM